MSFRTRIGLLVAITAAITVAVASLIVYSQVSPQLGKAMRATASI